MTISDWIFIGLGIILIIGFYFFFRRDVVYITARFKVTDENALYAVNSPNNEYAPSFRIGDSERDELGRVISEITGVESYKKTPEQQVVYLDIKLKAIYNPRKHQYSLQGKNIVYGESFNFSFTNVHFKALVVDFPGFKQSNTVKHGKTIVKAQLRNDSRDFADVYGVPEFVANAVKKGDSVIDSKGNILVRILDINVAPAKRMVLNNSGQPFMVDDPYLKDVFFTLELTTNTINGRLYMYDYMPVLIWNVVPLNLNKISIFPVITEIVI